MSYINPVEEYHNKLEPYRDDYDKYMQSFICPKCHEGVTDLEFLADKSSFTLVNETDKAETWCCRECTTEIETMKMPKVDDYYVPEIEVFGEDDIFNKNYMETINNSNGLVKRRRGANLKKASDVRKLLGKLINQALRDEITPELLLVVSYAAGMLLKSMEISDMEERLIKLEECYANEPKH